MADRQLRWLLISPLVTSLNQVSLTDVKCFALGVLMCAQRRVYAGDLKDACSLPFACVVQPFAKLQHLPLESTPVTNAGDVGRCHECYA